MHLLGTLLAAATPNPTPTPTVDPNLVTPGVGGFVIIALIVLAVTLLIIDMLRRVRNTRYRAEVNEQLDAEAALAAAQAQEADAADAVDAQDIDGSLSTQPDGPDAK